VTAVSSRQWRRSSNHSLIARQQPRGFWLRDRFGTAPQPMPVESVFARSAMECATLILPKRGLVELPRRGPMSPALTPDTSKTTTTDRAGSAGARQSALIDDERRTAYLAPKCNG